MPRTHIRREASVARTLGEFEKLVLFAVVALADEAYGVAVQEEIAGRTGREPSAGAVHTTLDRLGKRGLVESSMGESTPARGGRRKRFYRITPAGAAKLRESYDRVRAMGEPLRDRLDELAEA